VSGSLEPERERGPFRRQRTSGASATATIGNGLYATWWHGSNVHPATQSLQRWSVALLGAGLLVGSIGTAVATGNSVFLQPEGLAALAVISLGVVGVGVRTARSDTAPEHTARVTLWIGAAVAGSALLGAGTIALLADGLSVGLLAGAAAYFGTVGAIVGVLLGYNDWRRREQAATARSVRAAISQIDDAVAIVDGDGTFTLVNEAFVDLYRFDGVEELIGEDWRIRYDDEEIERMERSILPELQETGSWQGETTGVRADGETFTQELSLTRLADGQVVAIVRDVSERKARDREVERLALESTGTGIWEWHLATDEVVWNESLERLVGMEPGEFGGSFEDFAELVHPDDVPTMEAAVQEALEGGEMYQTEFRMERTDGSLLWAEARGRLIGEGEDRRMVGIISDVTDRKRRVSRLEETSSRLHLALGGASPAIWEWNTETDELVWNESMERTLGYAPGAFDGDFGDFVESVHPEDRATVYEAVEEARQGQSVTSTECRVADADGEYRWLDIRGKFVEQDGEEWMIGLVRDVTDRETYRRELERRQAMIESLQEATRLLIDASDVESLCESATEAAEEVLGAPLVGIWLADDAGERLQPVAATDAARETFGEAPTYVPGDGSLSWDAFESGEVRVFDGSAETTGTVNPDTVVRHEIVVPIGDRGVMNVATTEDRHFDDADVYGARVLAANLVAVIDRTSRETELRRQTDQLEFFNSILRHDVLNGMTVINARAELLADDLDGRHAEYAETILKWSENVSAVTGRVQRVLETLTGEEDAANLEPVDVSAIVAEHVGRLDTTHPAVTFEADVPDGVTVLADELLSDVLGNLLTNAVEHNDDADLTIRIDLEVADDRVRLEVADDGEGIPDDRKETVFRRGETGHAKETGSGFGLFFVDAMISRYGASIHVEDNDAGGATFVVELARADAPTAGPTATSVSDTDA